MSNLWKAIYYLRTGRNSQSYGPISEIEKIVNEVERELRGADSVEVESKKIGQLAAARLKKLDKVAYIRFASVFKRFVDIEDFEKEVKRVKK